MIKGLSLIFYSLVSHFLILQSFSPPTIFESRKTAPDILNSSLSIADLTKDKIEIENSSQEIDVRNAHAMTYDSRRGRVIVFGGADASKVREDTWEWSGRGWTQLSVAGPGPRTFPAMAYDSIRDRIVLFGGNRVLFGNTSDDNVFLADTWEWDGRKWFRIDVSGPRPRAEAAVAFDNNRGRVVLFGGYNRTDKGIQRLGDLWEWDGKKWIEVKVVGPSPRNGAALVYDRQRKKIVLFGGRTQDGVSGETWEWDGVRWIENRLASTEGRFNCVVAYDEVRRRVVRFAGRFGGKAVGDTWGYDGKEWRLLSSTGPVARNHTAMVYDSRRKKIFLFGGHDGPLVFGDSWEWDGTNWLKREDREAKTRVENGH